MPTATEQQASEVIVATPKMRKDVKSAADNWAKLDEERVALQAQKQSILEDLKAQGIPKEAFKRAVRDSALDEDVRAELDAAYAIVRSALGKPVQSDMFATGEVH